MRVYDEFRCKVLDRIILYVARDDQELELVATLPSDSIMRLQQDLSLVISTQTDSVMRMQQDVILVAIAKRPFPVTFVVT
jgi:hypothetical protein